MSTGVRLGPSKLSPGVLRCMSPENRVKYASTGPLAPAAVAMLTSDTGGPKGRQPGRTSVATRHRPSPG